jgi:hypothetical protein
VNAPFREPTLVASQREYRRGIVFKTQTYGERSGIDGRTDQIPAELSICKEIGRVLNAAYPGQPWMVEVDLDQGMAKVGIPPLLGSWTYNFYLDRISDEGLKKAAGEILERFKIPRSGVDFAAYMQAEKDIPMIGRYRGGHRALIPT